jgi:hypothetical protein
MMKEQPFRKASTWGAALFVGTLLAIALLLPPL